MPVFEYKGATKQGQVTKGLVQADNLEKAKTKLKKENIFIFELRDKHTQSQSSLKTIFKRRSVDIRTLCNMTRTLATLLKSSVPLADSLKTISRQVSHPVLGEAITKIYNKINEGHSFHKALSDYPRIFNTTYISMCEAGESSGTLDLVLLKLSEFTESQAELNNKIRSSLAYPILMIVFTVCVVLFLFTSIIPKITELFEDEEIVLPWYTSAVMYTSEVITNSWPIILLLLSICGFLTWRWTKTPSGKRRIDSLLLQLPFVGKLIRSSAISRFSRTLATLLNGGVPMLTAIKIAKNTTNNVVLKKALSKAQSNIREGESIARPLEESKQFPPMTIQMIKVGEKTGELENMLLRISDAYDFQVKTEVDTLTSLLGPIMIILMGGVVAVTVFSVMVPIFEMYNQVS